MFDFLGEWMCAYDLFVRLHPLPAGESVDCVVDPTSQYVKPRQGKENIMPNVDPYQQPPTPRHLQALSPEEIALLNEELVELESAYRRVIVERDHQLDVANNLQTRIDQITAQLAAAEGTNVPVTSEPPIAAAAKQAAAKSSKKSKKGASKGSPKKSSIKPPAKDAKKSSGSSKKSKKQKNGKSKSKSKQPPAAKPGLGSSVKNLIGRLNQSGNR